MKNPQNSLTLILALLIIVFLFVSNNNNMLIYGNWHFDASAGKFLQDLEKQNPDYYLNNMDFDYGSYPSQEIGFFTNNKCDVDSSANDITQDSVVELDVEEIVVEPKKLVVQPKPVVKKFVKKVIPKQTVTTPKVVEQVQEAEPVVKDEIVEDNAAEEVKEVTPQEVEKPTPRKVKKAVIKKPRVKDFKSSLDYQKALKKYYKAIE